jgi:hypothetical protein
VRRPSDQSTAIRRKAGGATRETSIKNPDRMVWAFSLAAIAPIADRPLEVAA